MKKAVIGSLELKEIPVEGYEKVVVVTDESVGLKAIIAIHDTTLGPALGGTRIYPYPTFEAALTDAKRLAKGMTYKSALAESGLGGGKSVIICHPKNKTKEMLVSFAEAINRLEGLYSCAEDSGCSMQDVTTIGHHTPYVVGLAHDKSSGNPAPFTAWGTFRGIQATLQMLDGSTSLEGKVVAVQGLGSVGSLLVDLLFWHGAKLIVSDIDWEKTQMIAKKYRATACPAEDILGEACDILAPCAMGGIINPQTIPNLRCRGIAGCANNQLLSDQDADELKKLGILYAPDFVINAGGLINVSLEIEEEGYNPITARRKTDQIYDHLIRLYEISEQNNCSTHHAALSLADYRIKYGVGKRRVPPRYHHFRRV
ncbi:MAG TPA: Glu/Leu/Phe/Val dehydrogenase dimerization domain-containing protein [Rhabdochlamydiaceae bacterium]|nr:Glu/Leu/Phe/Val dehydrogenase dimerization domain-containing protein [Rhabdochlamydiaceae bacterium]